MQERDCNTCKYHAQARKPVGRCRECANSVESLPWWEPIEFGVPDHLKGLTLKNAMAGKETSDGSSADYYKLPEGATQLQDLISHRNMNAQIGEIFRACYRMGLVSHSPDIRDVKKVIFYAQAELKRLENLASASA